jgi:mono/diheme cytochrome c family protein
MKPATVLTILICAALTPLSVLAQGDEGDDLIGLTEYEIACMGCHGLDGKGDGPKAKTLSTMPADLTQIAKKNDGKFPDRAIYDMIDGRGVIPAHGRRDMPIWGNRYRATAEPGEDPAEVEKRVRAMIEALVGYVAAIQEE